MRRSLTALLLTFTAIVVCFNTGADDSAAAAKKPRTKVITLERTECYGTCPIYHLTIYSDGRVEFVGERFVKKIGRATGRISRAQLENLVMEFTNIYYFNLPSSIEPGSQHCSQAVTDLPHAITSLTWQGKSHSINHYHGCRGSNTLELLRKLEDKIDATVNIRQWTK